LRLPSHSCWVQAYSNDPEYCALRDLVHNPNKICKDTLKDVHYCYHQLLQQSHIAIEDNMLVYQEPIQGSTLYTWLQIVPKTLFNIVFIAFHSNPTGGHFNAYRTLHRLRFNISGRKCTLTSRKFAMPAPAVHSPTQVARQLPNSCIIFPSKRLFGWSSWIHTKLAVIPVLKVTRRIFYPVAA
jgi:hypothetical protein